MPKHVEIWKYVQVCAIMYELLCSWNSTCMHVLDVWKLSCKLSKIYVLGRGYRYPMNGYRYSYLKFNMRMSDLAQVPIHAREYRYPLYPLGFGYRYQVRCIDTSLATGIEVSIHSREYWFPFCHWIWGTDTPWGVYRYTRLKQYKSTDTPLKGTDTLLL